MKKILKLSAIALLATSTSLMAQMTGPSVAVSVSHMKASTDGSQSGNAPAASGTVSRNFNIAALNFDYSTKLDNSWTNSIGIDYIPFKGKIGDKSRSDTDLVAGGTTNSGTNSAKGELKNHFTVYVEPTYLINPTNGIYAKVGYMHSDLNITYSNITGSALIDNKVSVHGVQYGVGYKGAIDKNLYVKAEYTVSNYASVDVNSDSGNKFTGNPETKNYTLSLGYTF
jgi:opacity protein-like surface antigen